MSTGAAKTAIKEQREHYRLSVNSYDRASSLLVAMLVMTGVGVAALLIIFFTRQFITVPVPPVVLPLDPAERPAEAAMGLKQDIEPPGIEEAPELDEPQLMDTLNALTSEMSSKVAVLSDEALDAGQQASKGSGFGDNRTSGGGGGAPEPAREYRIEVADADEYAAWLDFFKIEIIAATPSPNPPPVYYAAKLTQAQPTVRTAKYSEVKEHVVSPTGPHRQFIEQLAQKAGIADKGQIFSMAFPQETYVLVLGLEQQYAKQQGKRIDDIERTIFKVTTTGGAFAFEVEEQLYY